MVAGSITALEPSGSTPICSESLLPTWLDRVPILTTMVELSPDRATPQLPVTPAIANPSGILSSHQRRSFEVKPLSFQIKSMAGTVTITLQQSMDKFVMPAISVEHISISPGVCGSKPTITGHRIRVQDIVIWHERLGMTPDEIVTGHPAITLADVYAALAYYHDHQQQILEDIEASEVLIREVQAENPSILQQKLQTLKETHDSDDSIPSERNGILAP